MMNPNRRRFLQQAGVGIGALSLAGATKTFSAAADSSRLRASVSGERGLPRDWRAMRKFDAHNHVFLFPGRRSKSDWADPDNLVEAAAVLGIEKVFCSRP